MHTGSVEFEELVATLERDGLLLLSDPILPSVASLVAGGPMRGSWWGHPRGGDIYRLANRLGDQSHVEVIKLVSGKVTFVHQRLWQAVAAVGAARDSWQMDGLSEATLALLELVDEVGQVPWDDVPRFLPPRGQSTNQAVRVLEKRLLIHALEVHTSTGAHAKNLELWSAWAARRGVSRPWPTPGEARRELDSVLDQLNARHTARGSLPWHR